MAPIELCFFHYSRLQPPPALSTSLSFPRRVLSLLISEKPLNTQVVQSYHKNCTISPAEERVTSKKTPDPKGEKVAACVTSMATWVRGRRGTALCTPERFVSYSLQQRWEAQALLETQPKQQPTQLSSLLWAIIIPSTLNCMSRTKQELSQPTLLYRSPVTR